MRDLGWEIVLKQIAHLSQYRLFLIRGLNRSPLQGVGTACTICTVEPER